MEVGVGDLTLVEDVVVEREEERVRQDELEPRSRPREVQPRQHEHHDTVGASSAAGGLGSAARAGAWRRLGTQARDARHLAVRRLIVGATPLGQRAAVEQLRARRVHLVAHEVDQRHELLTIDVIGAGWKRLGVGAAELDDVRIQRFRGHGNRRAALALETHSTTASVVIEVDHREVVEAAERLDPNAPVGDELKDGEHRLLVNLRHHLTRVLRWEDERRSRQSRSVRMICQNDL